MDAISVNAKDLMMKKALIAAAALSTLLAGPAFATGTTGPSIFKIDGPQLASTAGYTSKLTNWDATFSNINGVQTLSLDASMGSEFVKDDGFWLVLNNGGNPKGIVNELAILYGDLKNNKITAYKYDGGNSPDSFTNASGYITTFNNAFTINGSSFSFSLDVTGLNSLNLPGWKGAQFGNTAGIWYHSTGLLDVAYDMKGRITKFGGGFGWYDTDHTGTTAYCANGSRPSATGGCGQGGGSSSGGAVPEPATLGLLGLGLAGLGAARRRRTA